jgi:ABC-2 type transport system permease protein
MTSARRASLLEPVNRHLGVIGMVAKEGMAYRFDFLTSILWSFLSMALVYFLWTAIFRSSASMAMPLQALITYVCMGQAFSFSRPSQRHIFMAIEGGIRSGNILFDLVRPTDYQALQFAGMAGSFLMDMVMVSIPSSLIAIFLFHISLPATPMAGFAFAVSMLGAYFLVFSLDFLLGLAAFWTTSVWGLGYVKMALMDVFAGGLVPLTLFPGWMQGIVMALPFKGMAFTPLAIWSGLIQGKAIWTAILAQYAWGIGLVVVSRLVWLRARRRIQIQGG